MATTVNGAFNEFMTNIINLDSNVVRDARQSRDNLLDNIEEFDNQRDFFDLYKSYNVHFGSFARKTKHRELDDIDLMIGISANGATYSSNCPWDDTSIISSATNQAQVDCTNSDGTLNSARVLNLFKTKLMNVREYSRSEISRKGEAVVLNLTSKDWSFDIVPCFKTTAESNGREYFLIPNGKGKWKKTDPTMEQSRIIATNQKLNGTVLDTVRLIKYWNKRGQMPTMTSYILETMLLDYFDSVSTLNNFIDLRFRDALLYIHNNILGAIKDSKGIEGDINALSTEDKLAIYFRSNRDHQKACDAIAAETTNQDHKKSIGIWREIIGDDFPKYG